MIRIESDTLEEAYSKAAKELSCSVTDIDIDIIQNASGGFLGMFKKNAIIMASVKGKFKKPQNGTKERGGRRYQSAKKANALQKEEGRTNTEKEAKRAQRNEDKKKPKADIKVVLPEIEKGVKGLMEASCFEIDKIAVSQYSEDTVLMEFDGEDAALLIGKEGYRYKALSYLLYNWISLKYGLYIRVEIAEFLKNQEEMIGRYLVPVIERVKSNGRAQTRVLDGVLIKIALEELRNEFPQKYVGIKNAREGGKFIVINDFNRKSS